MNDEYSSKNNRPRARSKLFKLAIVFAGLCILLLMVVLFIGAFFTFLSPVTTPELVLKIEAEQKKRQSRIPDSHLTVQDVGTSHQSAKNEREKTMETDSATTEPLFQISPNLTSQQRQERESINGIYQQCVDGFAECGRWDTLTYGEREMKLAEFIKLQQTSLKLMDSQFHLDYQRWKEQQQGSGDEVFKIPERYNALVALYWQLRRENVVRNQMWEQAAYLAESNSEMVYYLRRVETNGFIKFAMITTLVTERGYKTFKRSNPMLERLLP